MNVIQTSSGRDVEKKNAFGYGELLSLKRPEDTD